MSMVLLDRRKSSRPRTGGGLRATPMERRHEKRDVKQDARASARDVNKAD
jgi:hypothetical protein